MSDPADNPYQSPRGVEAPNAEASTNQQPFWARCLTFLGAGVLAVVILVPIYAAVVLAANLGVQYVGRGWTVLGFAALGISAIVLGVVEKFRKRSKRADR
jgi:hypothetical protein